LRLSLDNERAKRNREVFFSRPAFNQVDDGYCPLSRVFDSKVVPVETKKVPHCFECGALVPLFEGMSECNTGKQPDRQDNDILFPVGERVLWACQRAFEQSSVAEEVPFVGFLHFKPIVFNYVSIGSHRGSFGKGRSQLWKPPHKLAAQRRVIDLALNRLSMQDLRRL
jgi:hypothetical protein